MLYTELVCYHLWLVKHYANLTQLKATEGDSMVEIRTESLMHGDSFVERLKALRLVCCKTFNMVELYKYIS